MAKRDKTEAFFERVKEIYHEDDVLAAKITQMVDIAYSDLSAAQIVDKINILVDGYVRATVQEKDVSKLNDEEIKKDLLLMAERIFTYLQDNPSERSRH